MATSLASSSSKSPGHKNAVWGSKERLLRPGTASILSALLAPHHDGQLNSIAVWLRHALIFRRHGLISFFPSVSTSLSLVCFATPLLLQLRLSLQQPCDPLLLHPAVLFPLPPLPLLRLRLAVVVYDGEVGLQARAAQVR
jgi:hypothetical protein